MDPSRVGRAIRALRVRRGLTQADLGARAGLSRSQVSRIGTGWIERIPFGSLMRLAMSLDARLGLDLGWRGASLDRLIDERHTGIVDAAVRWLTTAGWDAVVEASFAIYGEGGSIDVFGRHPSGALLVIEVKASIGEANAILIGVDRKGAARAQDRPRPRMEFRARCGNPRGRRVDNHQASHRSP